MSTSSAHPPKHISFQSPADSLRQSTLKKNMSITQTYYLAHKARAKLSREAAQADHDLRLLVGHANLLDSLMLELADAEREQERWFNQSVRGANNANNSNTTTQKQQERHIQWADNIAEVNEEDDDEDEEDYDSDSSDDTYDEDDDDFVTMTGIPSLRPEPSKPAAAAAVTVQTQEVSAEDEDEIMEDDLEEDYAQLELVRTHSHSHSPPELVDESDSSDDESMPPSPSNDVLPMPVGKDAKEPEQDQSLYDEDYYLPRRQAATVSTTIPVY